MRIPKPVNTVLDWVEGHAGPLAAVTALVAAAVAALWMPLLAGFILGIAFGGFAVHLRMSKRMSRLRREVDDLLRENGSLRHRNTVLASGVITREAQVTQALVAIPEDVPLEDPLRTQKLPTLPDEDEAADHAADEGAVRRASNGQGTRNGQSTRSGRGTRKGGGPGDTADLSES